MRFGFVGSIATSTPPVVSFGGASTCCHVCAAVGRAVDAALRDARRDGSRRGREDPVRVRRVDDDAAERAAVGQAAVLPRRAAVVEL